MKKNLVYILTSLSFFLLSCQSSSSDESKALKDIQAIIESVANNDYDKYNSLLITKEELLNHGRSIGYEGNRLPDEKILKDVVEPNLSSRKRGFEIYKEEKVDWAKVNIDSVKVSTRKLMETETGKYKAYYVYEGQRCVMTYNSVMRTDDGSLKIGNVPLFGNCVE